MMSFCRWRNASTGAMRMTGQSISMGVTMMMIAIFVGKTQITVENHAQLMKCLQCTFGIFVAFCALGVYLSMVRNNRKDKQFALSVEKLH